MRTFSAIAIGLALAWLAAGAHGEIYKFVDASGAVRFTTDLSQVPPNQRAQAESEARARSGAHAPSPPASAAPSDAPAPSTGGVQRARHTGPAVKVFRDALLSGRPEQYGVERGAPVWGVVMEEGLAQGSYTLVALVNGGASVYFSTGGGVIGGERVPAVAAAARRVVEVATALEAPCPRGDVRCGAARPDFRPAPDRPAPRTAMVQFYLLTDAGPLRAEAPKAALVGRSARGWPLFAAGHDLLTQLREASERAGVSP